jgi:DNA repair exonuclease SbcCD ATPase subunit
MDLNELIKKLDEIKVLLSSWQDLARNTKVKSEELTKLQAELESREKVIEKETAIARERKVLLDNREKNIETQEDRLRRLVV